MVCSLRPGQHERLDRYHQVDSGELTHTPFPPEEFRAPPLVSYTLRIQLVRRPEIPASHAKRTQLLNFSDEPQHKQPIPTAENAARIAFICIFFFFLKYASKAKKRKQPREYPDFFRRHASSSAIMSETDVSPKPDPRFSVLHPEGSSSNRDHQIGTGDMPR